MKAVAVFPKTHEVRVIDIDKPQLSGPNQILVRTVAIGLCGTDREIVEQGYGNAPAGSEFLVLGHECLGEVLEVGSGVSRFQPGQLVVPAVRRPCKIKDCQACRSGRPDFCLTGQFTERGIVGAHGYMCECFADEQEYFHAVPEELRGIGVLTEPLTIAEKSLMQIRDVQDRLPYVNKADLKRGDLENTTSVILGAGPVGLLGGLALLNSGSKVFVYSRENEPSSASTLVEAAGGEYVSSSQVTPDQLLEVTGRVDIIYEATGASGFAFEMTSLLGRNGIYIFTGVPGRKAPVKIDTDRIMADMVLKNQLLVGSVNAGAPAYESAIHTLGEMQRRWPSVIGKLITTHITPEDVASHLVGKKEGIKTVVTFS